jgi:hypothetical protein
MHAELTTEGGLGAFPGLAKPVLLNAGDLSSTQNAEFGRLVSAARGESLSKGSRGDSPIPDGRTYRIVVDDNSAQLSLDAADPTVPAAFAALMKFIKEHGHR